MREAHAFNLRGASASVTIQAGATVDAGPIHLIADLDGDGLPDDYEESHGLNPDDATDADQDLDGDGLSAIDEYRLGTDPRLADTDGDGFTDSDEIRQGTNPLDRADHPSSPADLSSLAVRPSPGHMVLNTLIGSASLPLRVDGTLASGQVIDLAARVKGTQYTSSTTSVAVVNEDGVVRAIGAGQTIITVTNSGHQAQTAIEVELFRPQGIADLELPGEAQRVDLQGSVAFVACGSAGVCVVDLSRPDSPRRVAMVPLTDARDVLARGSLLYVAAGVEGLVTLDITNPTAPVERARLGDGFPSPPQGLALTGNHLLVASGFGGLQIVDVADPVAPSVVATLNTLGNTVDVDVSGDRAALADDMLGTLLVDVSIPREPRLISTLDTGATSHVKLIGRRNAVAAGVSRPLVPVTWTAAGVPSTLPPLSARSLAHETAVGLGFLVPAVIDAVVFSEVLPIFSVSEPARMQHVDNLTLVRPGSVLTNTEQHGLDIDGVYAVFAVETIRGFLPHRSGLRVAQLIKPSDTGRISPRVFLQFPLAGDTLVSGETITVQADATDDVLVTGVVLTAGTSTLASLASAPFEAPFSVPGGVTSLAFGARATDTAGNTGVAPAVLVNVGPDPLTTVTGNVEGGGQPVVGATVRVGTLTALTASNGRFEIPSVPTVPRVVTVTVEADVDGVPHRGESDPLFLVRTGATPCGTITLKPAIDGVSIILDHNVIAAGESTSFTVRGNPALPGARVSVESPDVGIQFIRTSSAGSTLTSTLTATLPTDTIITATYSVNGTDVRTSVAFTAFFSQLSPNPIATLVPGHVTADAVSQVSPTNPALRVSLAVANSSIATVSPSLFVGQPVGEVLLEGLAIGDTSIAVTASIFNRSLTRTYPVRVRAAAITILTPATLGVGETFLVLGNVQPADGTLELTVDRPDRLTLITLSSSASDISAQIVGESPGAVTLTARYTRPGGLITTETRTIQVQPSLTITGPRKVAVGGTDVFSATVRPTGGTVTFSSSFPQFGAIDPATGVVTGLAVGVTVIGARVVYPDGTSIDAAVTELAVTDATPRIDGPSTIPLGIGTPFKVVEGFPGGTLTTQFDPTDAATGDVTSDTDQGQDLTVTGLRLGDVTMTARYEGVTSVPLTATTTFQVTPFVRVTGPDRLTVGQVIDLDAQVNPTAPATFEVDDPQVALINRVTGELTALEIGMVEVRARTIVAGIPAVSEPFFVTVLDPFVEIDASSPRHVLVGETVTITATSVPPTPSVTLSIQSIDGQALLTPTGPGVAAVTGIAPGAVEIIASATVSGIPLEPASSTMIVLDPPLRNIVRQTFQGNLSIFASGTVTGAASLADSAVRLDFFAPSGAGLRLRVTEVVDGTPNPTSTQFALVDTTQAGRATVEFDISQGTSNRTLLFVQDAGTKAGGWLDLELLAVEATGPRLLTRHTVPLRASPSELSSLTGTFGFNQVQAGSSLTLVHGADGAVTAVGNSATASIRIDSTSVGINSSGQPSTTPVVSLLASGLTTSAFTGAPPTLTTTLTAPIDTQLRLRRVIAATTFSHAGTPGTTRSFTLIYEPVPVVELVLVNTDASGAPGRTVSTTGTLSEIGVEAGQSAQAFLRTDRGVSSLFLLMDEFTVTQEFRFDESLMRLPSAPDTFASLLVSPFDPPGTEHAVRGRAMMTIAGQLQTITSPLLTVITDRRPDVTRVAVLSTQSATGPGGTLLGGAISGSFDVLDPDETLTRPNTVGFVTIDITLVGGGPTSFSRRVVVDVNAGHGTSIPFQVQFVATDGLTLDTSISVRATPTDTLLLDGAARVTTARLGDSLTP